MESRVSIVRCQSYRDEEVLSGLRKAIELIGGIERIVEKGKRVLLKPNLLSGKPPEKAVTTHPTILKGMIQIVREAGGIPFIGDSPGVESTLRVAKKAGIQPLADEMKCPVLELNRPIQRGGRRFKQFEIDQAVLDADVIINLPKWKTHGQMLLTLGIKNLFGCIPGTRKALWHLKAGEDRRLFARMLVDLYEILHPSLTILDGIVGMEGNGPGSGKPISLGLILASEDAVSLDQVVCDLLGISRKSLLTNRAALERGLGKDHIEVVGERVEEARIPNFLFPPLSGLDWSLPGFLKRGLKEALASKPVVQEAVCSACNRCVDICPAKAIRRKNDQSMLDYRKCIRCFCCQEICPEGAVSIEPGWASKLYRQIRNPKSEFRNKSK